MKRFNFPEIDQDLEWEDELRRGGGTQVWAKTADIPEEEKDNFAAGLRRNVYLQTLRKMVALRYQKMDDLSPTDLSETTWAVKLAYKEGYRAALKDIYKLIPTDPQE